MKRYTYRISSHHTPNKVYCSGGMSADSMDQAHDRILKRNNIIIHDEYYGDSSMMAGSIYRTYFMMNDKKVSIAITSTPNNYRLT